MKTYKITILISSEPSMDIQKKVNTIIEKLEPVINKLIDHIYNESEVKE